ncbi:MAG: DUF3990 domain-containing protein [Oscillospiraceae bacterium]|nr:DUF3990 domain-containing protein [Oscillospiraceae bacterium]
MQTLIKQIRTYLNMSQTDFAQRLNVTFATVNRWENGRAVPNKLAQSKIYDLCKEKGVPVCDMAIARMTGEQSAEGEILRLYHGSKKGIDGEIAPISRSECDFGKGFYMGTAPLQPLTLVCNEEKPVFYTVDLDLRGLKVLTVDIGMDWAMLIAYYRKEMEKAKGTAIYEKYAKMAEGYDVIVGYIANDRMYTELSRFFNRTLTDVALINCLSALDLGKQYVAVSEKACKQIKIVSEFPISYLELGMLKDMSVARRDEGIALAEEIEVKYRREGKFFDELLRGE